MEAVFTSNILSDDWSIVKQSYVSPMSIHVYPRSTGYTQASPDARLNAASARSAPRRLSDDSVYGLLLHFHHDRHDDRPTTRPLINGLRKPLPDVLFHGVDIANALGGAAP